MAATSKPVIRAGMSREASVVIAGGRCEYNKTGGRCDGVLDDKKSAMMMITVRQSSSDFPTVGLFLWPAGSRQARRMGYSVK